MPCHLAKQYSMMMVALTGVIRTFLGVHQNDFEAVHLNGFKDMHSTQVQVITGI